jgi:hypothetical protein
MMVYILLPDLLISNLFIKFRCVYIWDTTTRKIVQKLGGHIGTVN